MNTANNQFSTTTLIAEFDRMDAVATERFERFNRSNPFKKGGHIPTSEVLTRFLVGVSKDKMDPLEEERLRTAVYTAVAKDEPIPIAFLWAIGGQAPSRYKFLDAVNVPRLGDFWIFYCFRMLQQKVQLIYPPGIEVHIVDELPQLEVLGFAAKDIKRRKFPMQALAAEVAPFVHFHNLPAFNKVRLQAPIEVNDDVIYTVVTTVNWDEEIPREVYDCHYDTRRRDYAKIRDMLPPGVWERAEEIQRQMSHSWQARKQTGYMQQRLMNWRPYVDAALTKKGRWCPDVWSMAFPQHGGSLLGSNGRFSVTIVPERRLVEEGCTPVHVAVAEFAELVGRLDFKRLDPHALYSGMASATIPFYWTR